MGGGFPTPTTLSPPPPHSSHHSSLPMLYYGLVVIGLASIVLAMYNLFIIRWCAEEQRHRRRSRQGLGRTLEPVSSRSFDNPNIHLVTSFKYKKEQGVVNRDQGCEYECPVCLSVFEEGEQVSQLPRCKHSFHSPCIDMWLFSHFDCPVCRAPVEPPVFRRQPAAEQPENSREGLLDTGISV